MGTSTVITYEHSSRAAMRRCFEALAWIGRPRVDVFSFERGPKHYLSVTCSDALTEHMVGHFVLHLDPHATEVNEHSDDSSRPTTAGR